MKTTERKSGNKETISSTTAAEKKVGSRGSQASCSNKTPRSRQHPNQCTVNAVLVKLPGGLFVGTDKLTLAPTGV